MRILILFLSAIVLLSACSGKQQLQSQISHWETIMAANKNPNDSILEPLMLDYAKYVQKYPEDDMAPIYLYRMGNVYFRMENWREATKHYEYVIDRYTESPAYPEALILAANVYEERMNNLVRAKELYKTYLGKFPNGSGKEKAEFFFQPEDVKARARIAELQKKLYSDTKNKGIDRQTAHLLVRHYLIYSQQYPNNEFTPIYCFEGGKLASIIGETADAVELWMTIYEQYHDFRLYPETMLLLAVEYENKMPVFVQSMNKKDEFKMRLRSYLKRFDLDKTDWVKEAEKMYRTFLEKYPKHELAPQVQALLSQLGKSPNEVVEGFKLKLDSLRQLQ